MIEFVKGDIFTSQCDALVNPVNLQGIMGNGLAREFKVRFPTNFKIYKEACYTGEKIYTGKSLVVRDVLRGRTFATPVHIVNFPTKTEWRNDSKIEYIRDGLFDLLEVIEKYKFKSIAIPPLGCGKGKLDWDKVKPLITLFMNEVPDVKVMVYEPI
jgi:O-acetyl-ADP-ribose deacetylase (regulator of RNase III)